MTDKKCKMKKHLSKLLIVFCLAGCAASDLPQSEEAQFIDMTGLDGCGWMIEVNNSRTSFRLEPINLSEFDIVPSEGMKVRIEYTEAGEMAGICMAGKMVRLSSIQEIK